MKFVVSVGSYERVLYGIDVAIKKEDKEASVKESFAIPAHLGYIKTVGSCPKFLVSGGTDENIRLFDLKKRKDVGSLSQHQGSISKAVFAGSSHLLTAGEDGRIAIFRSKDWECLHVLRHKKPINSLAVHPSGKLALSVGTDRSMKLWNLMTAKEASKTILPKEVLSIVFSESGDYFATLSKDNDVLLYRTDGAKCIGHVKSKARLICITFLRDEALYYAGEGSKIGRVDVPDSIIDDDLTDSVKIFDSGCTPRVKDMAILYGSGMDILIAGTSSGLIKAINLKDQETLFEHKSGLRITCLTASLQ